MTITPTYEKGFSIATREAYGNALVKARDSNESIIGLDGDTKNSTFAISLFKKYP